MHSHAIVLVVFSAVSIMSCFAFSCTGLSETVPDPGPPEYMLIPSCEEKLWLWPAPRVEDMFALVLLILRQEFGSVCEARKWQREMLQQVDADNKAFE